MPLSGIRAEFRTALRAEMEAATRLASAGAIPIVNGRQIATLASSYQYVFSAVSVLNVPSDAPAELLIDGRGPLDAMVISVEGLAVTLSVDHDLGQSVPSARLRTDMAFLLKRLIKRIEDTREQANPAGDRLLGAAAAGQPEVIDDELLTDSQDAALGAALGRDVTFIWGPPGTGKTQTIGAIGEQLYLRGRSVLLVSHTNAAVDQALLKIAGALDGRFEQGALLRLGLPSHPELVEREDLLLEGAVRERQRELEVRRAELEEVKEESRRSIAEIDRQLEVAEWAAAGDAELAGYGAELQRLRAGETELTQLDERVAELAGSDEAERRARLEEAEDVERDAREARAVAEQRSELSARMGALAEELGRYKQAIVAAEADLRMAREIEPLIERERVLPKLTEHRAALEALAGKRAAAHSDLDVLTTELEHEAAQLRASEELNALQRRLRRLPKPDLQAATVKDLEARRAGAAARHDALRARLEQMAPVLAELEELDARLAPHRQLGSPAVHEAALDHACAELKDRTAEYEDVSGTLERIDERLAESRRRSEAFERINGGPAAEIAARLRSGLAELDAARANLDRAEDECRRLRGKLSEQLSGRCVRLVALGLLAEAPTDGVEAGIDAVALAHVEARNLASALDTAALRAERTGTEATIVAAEAELEQIEVALAETRREVIADAAVVATTLTRAYLWDEIQSRRFDTVILDEASMAPIPALWIAAMLANANVVVVGDFRQLPPIKLADHELAERWLGRDVFEVSGVRAAYDAGRPPAHFVQLNEQFRMHPDISAIANTLIYDRTLHDDESVSRRTLGGWYRSDWGSDAPVTLVDTASTNAWASSVVARGRPTRVNFLSAVICVELAAKMLAEGTEPPDDGSAHILIATPYRGQARLLELLLRDAGIDGLVRAGTAHTFQGSEAPIVIFDLVIDEPHWRVALMIPKHDEANSRLLNVALTRAEQRLVFVGDFDYIRRGSKKAFLGREFLPFIEQRYGKIDATELISVGLSARAAHAQTLVSGAAVEASSEREVMTQAEVYPRLVADFASAEARIVIFSAFITENRLGQVLPHLSAAAERGVPVYVFTKAHEDRGKTELDHYRSLEARLGDAGVTVVHKPRMHEKLVFIDDDIAWTGSLNILSFRDTAEWMGRWQSKAVANDFAQPVSLEKVLAAYEAGEARCPVCGAPLVPAEGTEGLYWRCEKNELGGERDGKPHYTQNLDKPIPRDGYIRCARSDCDGEVEFRQGTKAPFWRCTKNVRHRQGYHPSHLRLPKMREVIVASVGVRELRKLQEAAGMPATDRRERPTPHPPRSTAPNPTLFDPLEAPATASSGNGRRNRSVTAVAIAKRLRVDPRTFRRWLRDRAAAGHPLLQEHELNGSWVFSSDAADELAREYQARRRS